MTPAPTKTPNNVSSKGPSNALPNHSSSSYLIPASSAANNTNSSSSGGRTGTIPKSTKISTAPNVGNEISGQHCQTTIPQQPLNVVQQQQLSNRCSPLNIVASQQLLHHVRSQHKNTEVVAPIRRELKDLNDYLLTTVVTTAASTSNNNSISLQQHNTGAANSDIENSQENQQRFCYPVRPIPRRNQPQHHQNQTAQNDFLNASALNSNLNTTIGVVIPTTPGLPSTNTSNAASVQPTINQNPSTTGTTTPTSSVQLSDNPTALGPQFEQQIQLIVLQRLKQLFENSQTAPFLNLTTSLLPGIQASSSSSLANTILNHNTNEITQLAHRFQNLNTNQTNHNPENSLTSQQQQKPLKAPKMVHEINPSSSNHNEIVVNSTSLEDVPHSDRMSDRAQSIQSLHSNIETPTPENTPSYEELQQRLEASNRNIQNLQEQQQQLLKLQNAAKQHLSDMERLKQQAGVLSFPSGSQNGGGDASSGAPEYQSIGQVHNDMATLVGRMKNLTTFIQNQNELSNLLGDDGPEILAEQEVLHRKLESLRAQRDEMRNLVSELQQVNESAEESAKEARKRQFEQEKDIEENDHEVAGSNTKPKKTTNVEREVPVELTRNVPIELTQRPQRQDHVNGHNDHSETETDMDEDERKETSDLIQQKMADVAAMKAQLKRLKDMMETVHLIEAHNAKEPNRDITRTRDVPITFDRERTPIAATYNDDNGNEEFLTRKVRMLNEVASDLKAQTKSLQAEKDRIQQLRDEIEKRKNQAAAAVQLGDDALKRNSLTPTPVPPRTHEERWEEHMRTQNERDQLKEEYERKKKEFEVICKRLEQEENPSNAQQTRNRQDIVSEADDEAEEDNVESDYAESTKFVPTSTPAILRNNENHNNNNITTQSGKDSLNSTGMSSNTGTHIAQAASSAHDASLEAASLQSGSSRSFSIPPPMSSMGINFPGPIPPPLPTAWNPYYYAAGVPPPPPPPQSSYGMTSAQVTGNTATLSNSECICATNNNLGATSSSTATSAVTNNGITTTADPMLQQFIQTQQMLINSVCQCNQMLWHQQREIDNLNQTIHLLQERIISLGGIPNINNSDVGYTLRSESVPPPSLGGIPQAHALPNNLYMSANRAQSEQPTLYMPGHQRSSFGNYQQHQNVYRSRISQQQAHAPSGYNFSAETQQHNSSSATATANIYSTLNNAAVPQTAATTLFNNEIPTPPSPVVGGNGPAPIFMHHHNNSIHQNNANLRTQNQQQQHHHSNISGNTLNNQVPPGNRANNYWDNFRSYSRQNLLSTNSTKSNEEQQQHNQQCQPDVNGFERPQSMEQHPRPQYQQENLNLEDCANNLNYSVNPNNEASSKYLRILQRSRINQQQQQQQYRQNANTYQQQREFLQQLNWLENNNSNTTTSSNNTADLYHNYNIQQNNKVGPKPNWRFRNLNEEYNHRAHVQPPTQPQQQPPALPRYQNTSGLTRQQQASLAAAAAAATNTQHFLNLPQSQTPPPSHDFLLQLNEDVGGDYNFLNSHAQHMPLDFSTNHRNIPTECNDEYEEDDTTSEEIKRNLLVNALKNDKFTTKFYESIKEDVFRRLESMLLDKENVQQPTTTQSEEMPPSQQLINNISNHHNSLRKLNLNEQRDQMQQLHYQQQQQQPLGAALNSLNCQQNISDDSNNARNEFYEENGAHTHDEQNEYNENEKAEEDTNWRQNNMNNGATALSPQICSSSTTTSTSGTTTGAAKSCTKKRKNVRKHQISINGNNNAQAVAAAKQEDPNENVRGACSLAAQQHHQKQMQNTKEKPNENKDAIESPATTSQSHKTDLIKYIIARIRNQTHVNTIINDALLVEVAKLTANVAQNAQHIIQSTAACNYNINNNNISPKKIYTKIKKLTIPKERDEFLSWYQNYLENNLFGHPCVGAKTKSSSNGKATNNQTPQQSIGQQNSHVSPVAAPPPPTDDGDLAEADQNCSSNTSANYHHVEETEEQANNSNTLIISTNSDVENLENPHDRVGENQENIVSEIITTSNLQMGELSHTLVDGKNEIKNENVEHNDEKE
ncbi:combover [Haematobia irritans]|uniref:combover n=1 Tax=Haematobia irritans TaxID=7368 RepID=UPI003F508C71